MNPRKYSHNQTNWLHLLLLLGWLVIGLALRFANLGAKPASSIEIATLGFSLGHGFALIPLDRVIDSSTLLSSLSFDSTIKPGMVLHRLLTESTHPPLYFWLTHWWIKLFTQDGELVSLAVGRSLSAIFGGLAIPGIFGFCWVAFRSKLIAQIAAALMAVSPYGIYLAQEARHYTLTILGIIASLTCLIVAAQYIYRRRYFPMWLGCLWIVVNSLAIATHYFFALALVAQALTIIGLWRWDFTRKEATKFSFRYWWGMGIVGLGTLIGCLVWLPVAIDISSNELTDWIQTSYDLEHIWQPIPRLMAWLITMIMLLPIEGIPTVVLVISGLVVLLLLIWLIPALIRGGKLSLDNSRSKEQSKFRLSFPILWGYWLGAMIIFLLVIYGLSKDVSLAARYHFVYFPVVLVLIAVSLANIWHTAPGKTLTKNKKHQSKHNWYHAEGKKVAIVVVLIGLIGALTVINDYGFQKSRHADKLAQHIKITSTIPSIVATTYETSSQLRELIALGLSFEREASKNKSFSLKTPDPQFLLVQQNSDNNQATLSKILTNQPKPFDLWGINLKVDQEKLLQLNCLQDNALKLSNSGYKNRLYHCR